MDKLLMQTVVGQAIAGDSNRLFHDWMIPQFFFVLMEVAKERIARPQADSGCRMWLVVGKTLRGTKATG